MRTILLACVAVSLATGCAAKKSDPAPIPAAPAPPVAGAIQGLTLAGGWTNPRALPAEINTIGWEDSANISADGKTLYFSYTQYDFAALASSSHTLVLTGPNRPGMKGPGFDVFEATIAGGAWSVADSTVNSADPQLSEAATGVDVDETRMAFINFSTNGDIYLSEKTAGAWAVGGTKLPPNVNTTCVEDNPTLSADGLTLWFDSNRSTAGCQDGHGTREVFVTHDLGGGAWSDPVVVTGGPGDASQGYAWQAFVTADGSEIWWSGFGTGCSGSALCLYEAPRVSDDVWGTPSVIITPSASGATGQAYTLGEASITADGHYLYFAYITNDSAGRADINLGVAEHP